MKFATGSLALVLAAAAGLADAQTPAPTPPAPVKTAVAQAADKPDLAYGAYQRGAFRTALSLALKRLADNPKDTAAMTLIGEIYKDGAAVKQDFVEASHWLRLASDLGDPQGAFELGAMLVSGAPGLPADRPAGLVQFQRAAAKGLPTAFYNLGVAASIDEKGHPPDFAAAAEYFRKGAEGGDAQAAYSYGELLRAGRGVDTDYQAAAKWLKMAADQGLVEAEVEFGIMQFNGDGIMANEAEGAKYLRRAAGRHNPIAENRLARLYLGGRGVPKDIVLAEVWNGLAKAAGLGDASLEAAIGTLSPADDHKAAELIRAYAEF